MKKTIVAVLTLFTLATGATFAQGAYPRSFDTRPAQPQAPQYNNDQYQDELKIDRLDALVGLSRRQEREIRRIENNYDHMETTARQTPDGFRQLQLRKRQDILAVLTSAQRDQLFAAQRNNRFNRNQPGPFGRRG